jgi:hypothetical protein
MGSGSPEEVLAGTYEPGDGLTISTHVVRLVAIASDRREIDLEPLGRRIDTDQLDALFDPAFLSGAETRVSVKFAYEGYVVDIDDDGTVRILEPAG